MNTRFTAPLHIANFTEGSFEIVCTTAALSSAQKSAIKQACGRYTECRGHTSERRITIPLREMALADRLIVELGRRQRPNGDRVTVLMSVWHTDALTNKTIYVRDLTPVFTVQSVSPEQERPAQRALEQMVREINARRRDGSMTHPLALHEFQEADRENDEKLRREKLRRALIAQRVATKLQSVSLEEAARMISEFSADMSNLARVVGISAIIDEPIGG